MNDTTYSVYAPGGIYVGQVKTQVIDDGLIIINRTQSGHIFDDGQVVRGAYQGSTGNWYMLTYGTGNNKIPDMNYINAETGPEIFRNLDNLMKDYIANSR